MSCVDQEQTDEDLVEEIRRVRSAGNNSDMSCVLRKPDFCIYAKSKMQISCAADLHLCFHIYAKSRFSQAVANLLWICVHMSCGELSKISLYHILPYLAHVYLRIIYQNFTNDKIFLCCGVF